MSYHVDSPTAIEDGRLNLCDLFAFSGEPGRSVFVVTVNPDAGRSSPTSLRPEALYHLVVAAPPGVAPGAGLQTEALDASAPVKDVAHFGASVEATALALTTVARIEDPTRHAAAVAAAFLPDVLGFEPGVPAVFRPGGDNGRALTDDAFGIAIALATGTDLASSPAPLGPVLEFPHLAAAGEGDLPALAELFGLRSTPPTTGA